MEPDEWGGEVPVAFIEGLAAVGKLRGFKVERCAAPQRRRIVAVTADGRTLRSRCIDERGLRRVVLVLNEYTRRLSRVLVEGEPRG